MKKAILKKVGAVKRKTINATANVLSAPAQLKSKYIQNRAKNETGIIKYARSFDQAPNRNNDGTPSDAYKARFMADITKDKILKRNAKRK